MRHSTVGVIPKYLIPLGVPAVGTENEADDDEVSPQEVHPEWMQLAENLPNARFLPGDLGAKNLDEQHQWYANPDRYQKFSENLEILTSR